MAPASALALALEAHRDRALLEAARQAPLPADIGRLLALLSGRGARLRAAAAEAGADEGLLLEAARGYVRDAMLHEEADDARLLGLGPCSQLEDLKRNYRALQAWLHPDRDDGPDDAAQLSARVNAAWSRLRSAGPEPGSEPGLRQYRPRWRKVDLESPPPRAGTARRVGLALAAVAGLAWLVAWRLSAPQPEPARHTVTAIPPAESESHLRGLPRLAEAATSMPATPAATSAGDVLPPPRDTDRLQTQIPVPSRDAEPDELAAIRRPRGPGAAADAVASTRAAPAPVASRQAGAVEPAPAPVATRLAAPEAMAARGVPAEVRHAPVPAAAIAVAPAAPVAPAEQALADPARQRRAQASAASLYDYLLPAWAAASVPPIWHSGSALDQADRARRALSSHGSTRIWILQDQADWQFAGEQAQLRVPVASGPGRGAQHTLNAHWQWKNGDWWVTGVALEETQ